MHHDSFHTSSQLQNPTTIQNRYKILKRIGAGNTGLIYLAQDLKLNRKVAIKTPDNTLHQNNLNKEATYHAKTNHPNITTLSPNTSKENPYTKPKPPHKS